MEITPTTTPATATTNATTPTTAPPSSCASSPFALLDSPEEWASFSHPKDTNAATTAVAATAADTTDIPNTHTWESHIVIEGMHCAACSHGIENLLKKQAGVLRADISAATHRGRILWRDDITRPSHWMQAITDFGYAVAPAQDIHNNQARKKELRTALWRWLVAGFCMMQVMMYATPEYIAPNGDILDDTRTLLRWASWLLTLPVILFSCQPFWINAWQDLRLRRISMDLPVALGMLLTFIVSSLGTFAPDSLWAREVYFDSLTMFVFFLLSARWLETKLKNKTAGALEQLMNRMPDSVLRQTPSGEFEAVLLKKLKQGDIVRVAVGQAFPADGTILNGTTHADESLLTGESTPIAKTQNDPVIAGSFNLSSRIDMQIQVVGENTRFSQIVRLMEQAATEKPQLAQLADRLAKPFLSGVLFLAGLAALFHWQQNPAQALMAAAAVLIVTCPCALSLATPAAMLAAAGACAKQGILVRKLQALETLARLDTLIFDKTGTLTEDGLGVQKIHLNPTNQHTIEHIRALAQSLAQDSPHPIAKALMANPTPPTTPAHTPAHTAWQIISRKEISGSGIEAQLIPAIPTTPPTPPQSAPHTSAPHISAPDTSAPPQTYRLGSAAFCGAPELQTTNPQVHLADNASWLASFEFNERIRPDALQTLQNLAKQNIAVWVLSGDSQRATQHLARQLHIQNYQGLCTPNDKLTRLQNLQQQGHCVGMVGDGINDAPVLAGAHVSFAIGRAAPLTQSHCDFFILGTQLHRINQAKQHAQFTMRVVKQNLAWSLLYNAIAVPLAVGGWLPAWLAGIGMACSSLIVVINAMRLRRIPSTQ